MNNDDTRQASEMDARDGQPRDGRDRDGRDPVTDPADALRAVLSVDARRDNPAYWDALANRIHAKAREDAASRQFSADDDVRWLAARVQPLSWLALGAAAAMLLVLMQGRTPDERHGAGSGVWTTEFSSGRSFVDAALLGARGPSLAALILPPASSPTARLGQ